MSSFSGRAVIHFENEKAFKEIKDRYGSKVTLMAAWSYSGELVDVEDLEDIDKLNSDDEYGNERLMNSNLRA